jgi:glutamate dehydrogenase (NADP+)
MLRARGDDLDGKTCVVSGSGNVAIFAIEKLQAARRHRGRVLGLRRLVVHDPARDRPRPAQAGQAGGAGPRRGLRRAPARGHGPRRRQHLGIPCQVALPSRRRTSSPAGMPRALVRNGCIAVAEGANMPCTADGVRVLARGGRGLRAGQGGQRRGRGHLGARDAAERQPGLVDVRAHRAPTRRRSWPTSTDLLRDGRGVRAPGNYVAGANIAGFLKVGRAMLAFGLI